jgi:hypothetical protein
MTRGHLASALLAVGLTVTLATAFAPAAETGQNQASANDPLTLFTKTFPVYTHPRCLGCHGLVKPDTYQNHTRDFQPGMACTSCHIDEPDWRLAPPQFVNLTARELCNNLAEVVNTRRAAGFMRHLETDRLIIQAFGGLAGGAREPANRLPPPPVSYDRFKQEARAWVEDGLGQCDREGEIQHTESIHTHNTYDGGSTTVQQAGSRIVRVRFANGRFVSNVQVLGSITITKTITAVVNGVPCTTSFTSTANYADKDDPGPEQSNLGITALARVEIKFAGPKYTVTVRLPEETHQQIDGGAVQDGCGTGLQASPPETLTMTWPGTSFVFRGTQDPNDRRRLVGTETRTVTTQVSPDEDPWLHGHYAASVPLDDTSLFPVTVVTRWNIQYRP